MARANSHRKPIKEVTIPQHALIKHSLHRIDYFDVYAVNAPQCHRDDIDALLNKLFQSSPKWIVYLMQLRDQVVAPFGLKTSNQSHSPGAPEKTKFFRVGDKLGIFCITERSENELVMGENDKHLNFRVSLLKVTYNEQTTVTLTTIVRFNNLLGRIYFAVIKPFHKAIVQSMLASLTN